jgi:hypothetical protein
MDRLSKSEQTRPVIPLPAKGSKIKSFALELDKTILFMSS